MRLNKPTAYVLIISPLIWIIFIHSLSFTNTIYNLAIFVGGAVIMRSAGCIINDMWDVKIDRQVARTKDRPLAKGELNLRQSFLLLLILLVVGLSLLLLLTKAAIIVGLVGLFLTILYPLAKRFTYFAQVILGFTFNLGVLMFSLHTNGSIDIVSALIYLSSVLWTIGYDTIYGCQDMLDDRLIGTKSMSLLYGEKVPVVVWKIYQISVILMALAGFHANLNLLFFVFLALGLYILYLQTERIEIYDQSSCKKAFDSNIGYGMIIFLGIIVAKLFNPLFL